MKIDDQPDLFENPFVGYDRDTIKAFKEYHEKHPDIFEEFRKYSIEMRNTGRAHYGSQSILEKIRWHVDMMYPDQHFKVNNNFSGMYARLMIQCYPEFKEFFRTRKVRGLSRPHFDKEDLVHE
jgi:hypothetical protein